MKIYSVLTQISEQNSSTEDSSGKIYFIEEGFSFLALIFQVFWLIYHGIWVQAVIIMLIKYAIFMALKFNVISEYIGFGAGFIVAIIIAMFAKTWYIDGLKKAKYQLSSVIVAENMDQAKLNFYQKRIYQEFCKE